MCQDCGILYATKWRRAGLKKAEVGDIITVALDLDARTLSFAKNGESMLIAGEEAAFANIEPGTYHATVALYYKGHAASFV